MSYENLLVETKESIGIITINRPKALNALNTATLEELGKAFAAFNNDDNIKVIVLTGAGEKAFVAGADIAAMQHLDPLAARDFAYTGQRVFSAIETMPKPVIAAIGGFALGGGCELAMACDIRVASENAKFGQPEVSLGVLPGFAGTQRLPRLVGKGIAKELIYTGDTIDAARAYAIGLANTVVPPGEHLAHAIKMAEKIASKGPLAVRFCKEAINNGMEMDMDRACAYEAELFAVCFSTADRAEGMTAFLEKRKPVFQNK